MSNDNNVNLKENDNWDQVVGDEKIEDIDIDIDLCMAGMLFGIFCMLRFVWYSHHGFELLLFVYIFVICSYNTKRRCIKHKV